MPSENSLSKIVGDERMDPSIMQFILEAAANAQRAKLIKLEEAKIPTGYKSIKVTVSDSTMELILDPPWLALSIANDSSSYGVYHSINDQSKLLDQTPVNANGIFDVKFDYPIIKKLYLKAESGGSAVIRIFGVEGKRWQT